MKSYQAEVTIDAGPDAVWSVLTDVAHYTEWDSGIDGVEGTVGPGARITVRSQANPGRAFPLTVTGLTPPREMVWSGGMPLGLFSGVRRFTLSPRGAGRTHFLMREEYTGPLLGLIWRSMPDLQPSFDQFARGLKSRVERGPTPPRA